MLTIAFTAGRRLRLLLAHASRALIAALTAGAGARMFAAIAVRSQKRAGLLKAGAHTGISSRSEAAAQEFKAWLDTAMAVLSGMQVLGKALKFAKLKSAAKIQLRPGSKITPKSNFDYVKIAEKAEWRGNQLNKHAWNRHPGLAKNGANQLPNTEIYNQSARQTILDADIVITRTKGDVIFLNSKTGLATGIQELNGKWYINSHRLQTVNP